MPSSGIAAQVPSKSWQLSCLGKFPRMRALAWSGHVLYASRGYDLFCAEIVPGCTPFAWKFVARFSPAWWRKFSSSSRLLFRLVRDGFHALAILPSGKMIAAVPGAIVTLAPGETEFRVTHRISRGTRPLHIASTPDGRIYWGEYFDNPTREEVVIYGSTDGGETWSVPYAFPAGAIRHVHNIVYDPYVNCLWILTGDEGGECQILRASCDLKNVQRVLGGNQQTRAAAAVPTESGLYFSSDTPQERNHIYCLDRSGGVRQFSGVTSSSIYGCRVGGSVFFSTMVEPSAVNIESKIRVYGTANGVEWHSLLEWKKDGWPSLFQYGNAIFPDGQNESGVLALTTVAVEGADQQTSLWI